MKYVHELVVVMARECKLHNLCFMKLKFLATPLVTTKNLVNDAQL